MSRGSQIHFRFQSSIQNRHCRCLHIFICIDFHATTKKWHFQQPMFCMYPSGVHFTHFVHTVIFQAPRFQGKITFHHSNSNANTFHNQLNSFQNASSIWWFTIFLSIQIWFTIKNSFASNIGRPDFHKTSNCNTIAHQLKENCEWSVSDSDYSAYVCEEKRATTTTELVKYTRNRERACLSPNGPNNKCEKDVDMAKLHVL